MGNHFLEIAGTPSVAAAQAANGSGALSRGRWAANGARTV